MGAGRKSGLEHWLVGSFHFLGAASRIFWTSRTVDPAEPRSGLGVRPRGNPDLSTTEGGPSQTLGWPGRPARTGRWEGIGRTKPAGVEDRDEGSLHCRAPWYETNRTQNLHLRPAKAASGGTSPGVFPGLQSTPVVGHRERRWPVGLEGSTRDSGCVTAQRLAAHPAVQKVWLDRS